jgi:hypothetical protein
MTSEQFLKSYQNASTPPDPDIPPELASFMLAADPVLAQAAELARVLARSHQGAATQLIGEGWAHARKYFSLSEKYAAWADYHEPQRTSGSMPTHTGSSDRYVSRMRSCVHIPSGETSAPKSTAILRCEAGWLSPSSAPTAPTMVSSRPRTGWRATSPNRMRPTW